MGPRPDPKQTLTLEQWRALDPTGNNQGPTRPVTDRPIGALTDGKRDTGAMRSDMFTDHSEFQLRPNPPAKRETK